MTDQEAFQQLVKAVNHLEEAEDLAESESFEGQLGRAFDFATDAVNAYIDEHGDHDCIYQNR